MTQAAEFFQIAQPGGNAFGGAAGNAFGTAAQQGSDALVAAVQREGGFGAAQQSAGFGGGYGGFGAFSGSPAPKPSPLSNSGSM